MTFDEWLEFYSPGAAQDFAPGEWTNDDCLLITVRRNNEWFQIKLPRLPAPNAASRKE